MMTVVLFVMAAAAATLVRAIVTSGQDPAEIPWRTLAVNCAGAFLLGLISSAGWWDSPIALTVAGMGSLTTFSTVAGETATLLDDGRRGTAIAYVGITLVAGVAAAWFGINLGDPT